MRAHLAAACILVLCACEAPFVPVERDALTASPSEGIAVVPSRAGGSAAPISLGGLTVHERGSRLRGRAVQESADLGGLGLSGVGEGGGGYGSGYGTGHGAMFGSGGGRVLMPFGEAEASRERKPGSELEVSPWAYAEISLPYQGGSPAHFEARADTRINPVVDAKADLLSTFAIDVDTAAYSIARRSIESGKLPEPSLVRVEELVNYFRYDYEPPQGERELFSIQADGARSPVQPEEHILRVGLQARVVGDRDRPPANLVFLVDTSCSMTSPDKLPLAKQSLAIAVDHLNPDDHVAITTYAGGVALVLPSTPVREKARIKEAIARLTNGGGTAMASGLTLAYEQAARQLGKSSISRIIVCSDGDANIGATTPEKMLEQVASYVSEGVTLSTIGFGDGNYKDAVMEQLADKGNGNYYYVDSLRQAERVFGRDLTKMLLDVAQDVKVQVAFNPDRVLNYRLIGYENRNIADKDFRNDRVDAGEIGAGHQVTALYGLMLVPGASGSRRLATIHVRAKKPRGMTAREVAVDVPLEVVDRAFAAAPGDLRFAVAVMGAAELLRGSRYAAGWRYADVLAILAGLGGDRDVEAERPDRDPDRAGAESAGDGDRIELAGGRGVSRARDAAPDLDPDRGADRAELACLIARADRLAHGISTGASSCSLGQLSFSRDR